MKKVLMSIFVFLPALSWANALPAQENNSKLPLRVASPPTLSGPVREKQPLAAVANLVLTRGRMWRLHPILCRELGLSDGKDYCPFRQVVLEMAGAREIFDTIENPQTGRIDIVLFHQAFDAQGELIDGSLYLTSPDAQLRKAIYGKKGGRRVMSKDEAVPGFLKLVYFWISKEEELAAKLPKPQ